MGKGGDLSRVGDSEMMKFKGYIAFTTLLVISAVVFLVGVTLTLLAVFQVQQSLSHELGSSSYGLAEGCVEDALLASFSNDTYNGVVDKIYPEGICTVLVVKQVPANIWTFDVTSTTATLYYKNLQVSILRGGSIQILSWKQVE
ncbi:MAG: hypothetical protein UY40_C0008G0016 [candidate division CPR1 bacterium GW2011_GWC1_49_13]|uniref:Uncharacterized protein n=1 Tax=candidate division CPR1 bacterium GW2011_GWC1_49_13 TaxID=1618342 RepID=A0A0G1YHB9_9BACT|nr:MAG: hypothetical protein UY40_C0008G0016 [candidate division CPR1 bacterium GW2011_GWC1_49_13]